MEVGPHSMDESFFLFLEQPYINPSLSKNNIWVIEPCNIESIGEIESSKFTFRVCLVGVKTERMENRKRKIVWKMLFSTVWLRKENRRDQK